MASQQCLLGCGLIQYDQSKHRPDLFTGSLDQIQLADVEQFLNLQGAEDARPIEGPPLDFKLDAPQDMGDHVAALANTYGGLLLVGVRTKKVQKNIPDDLPGSDLGPDPRRS